MSRAGWLAVGCDPFREDAVLGVAFFRRYGRDHGEVGCLAIHHDYRKVREADAEIRSASVGSTSSRGGEGERIPTSS